MKIVITGASGFIGGHLIEHLSGLANTEIIPLSRRELPNLIRISNYSEAPLGDLLMHLAKDNKLESVANKGRAYENEALSTLDRLLFKKYKRIIYISSSTLYGDESITPLGINDEIFAKSPYIRIKSLSESAVLKNLSGIVVRLANVYGPLMSTDPVISQTLKQIPQEGNLEVGDVTPIRDFVWVRDVVEEISKLELMDIAEVGKPKMYNIGRGVGTSIGALALLILELAVQPERRVVSKNQTRVASNIVLDYSDMTSTNGRTLRITLRQGIESLLISNLRSEN